MDKKKKVISVLISIFIVCAAVIFFTPKDKKVEIVLPKGSSVKSIASKLKQSDIIYSENLFIFFVKIFNYSKDLKAGKYEFNTKDNMFTIIKKIKNGQSIYVKVTIPEGFTIKEIANLLEQKDLCKAENFINLANEKHMEGFLLPETYFFDPLSTEIDIINEMNNEFKSFFTKELQDRAAQMNLSVGDAVTLASIIEKEAVSAEERPVIAGVFINRLKKNMRLQSCATVFYATGIKKERLTLKDLQIESKYNTYKYKGLPPGPICNPGRDCITAALYPAVTDNLFFVSKGNGTHQFSNTFEQHKKNKIVYKEKATK